MTRFETLFVSLVALMLGCLLLILGGALILSPTSLHAFAMEPVCGGSILALFGLGLLIAFYSLNRHRFLRFRTKGYSISEELLTELAETSLRTLYPNASCQVLVRQSKKLEVTMDLGCELLPKPRSWFRSNASISASLGITEEELEQIETILQETFAQACGFKEPFRLNLIATV